MSTDRLQELLERATEIRDRMDQERRPSKAHLIAHGGASPSAEQHFFATVAKASSLRFGGVDGALEAKAELDAMGATYAYPEGKATIGDTNAAGGFLVPGAVVAAINEAATPQRSVVDLFASVDVGIAASVLVPFENSPVTRAVIAAPGTLKQNQDIIVGGYSATLYTLARIFDISNQLLRQSGGAAEKLARSRLARAFGLGEDYYALNGAGTTEPYGLLTAIGTSGPYVSTFSSPADNTVAGSVIAAVSVAAGALEDRGGVASGIIMNTSDFWRMRRQGADTAGFWLEPSAPVGRDVSVYGIPLRASPNVPSDTIVVGDFSEVSIYRGLGYRVDVSSEAGTRWDYNLTGFRGELEIGLDCRPAV